MIKIKRKLVITAVVIMLSLTVYTIYGGMIDNEEIKIRNAIDNFFSEVKEGLGERAIDIAVKENIKYEIKDIDINNDRATVEIKLTGLDLAKSFYEMDMYHAFYREFSLNSRYLFTQPIMDTYKVYIYILNKNINNTQTTDLMLLMNKTNDTWEVINPSDVYRGIEKSSIDLKTLSNKAYENLEKARETIREKYNQEQQQATYEEYWVKYLYDFITNAGYATQYPFEEQQFIPIN